MNDTMLDNAPAAPRQKILTVDEAIRALKKARKELGKHAALVVAVHNDGDDSPAEAYSAYGAAASHTLDDLREGKRSPLALRVTSSGKGERVVVLSVH